jgi:hypothetical protein
MSLEVKFIDSGREPKCAPNPKYPNGIDLDMSKGASATCEAQLPYPTPRCGYISVVCDICGLSVLITTAGRIDDPKSIKLACQTH